MGVLYHVSGQPDITRFDPRPDRTDKSNRIEGEIVWAIDHAHLVNQLLPHDCPRVTFGIAATTTPADIARFMSGTTARRVIAIESAWLPRLLTTTIYCYEFEPNGFTLSDAPAGYFVSRTPVIPRGMRKIDNIVAALLEHDAELRFLPTLWSLHDLIAESSLEFSIMRMRFAQPQPCEG